MTRAEQQVRRATVNAWERVCRDLSATEAEVRSALALMRAGRARGEVDDPMVSRTLEEHMRIGNTLAAWNTSLTPTGGGSSSGKPESREPGYLRCPDVVAAFRSLTHGPVVVEGICPHCKTALTLRGPGAAGILRDAHIERKASEAARYIGDTEITEPELHGEWADRKTLDVDAAAAELRAKGAPFGSKRGPYMEPLRKKAAEATDP